MQCGSKGHLQFALRAEGCCRLGGKGMLKGYPRPPSLSEATLTILGQLSITAEPTSDTASDPAHNYLYPLPHHWIPHPNLPAPTQAQKNFLQSPSLQELFQ